MALVSAVLARYVSVAVALPVLAAAIVAFVRFYIGVTPGGGNGRPRRKAKPYRGPSTKKARHRSKTDG